MDVKTFQSRASFSLSVCSGSAAITLACLFVEMLCLIISSENIRFHSYQNKNIL